LATRRSVGRHRSRPGGRRSPITGRINPRFPPRHRIWAATKRTWANKVIGKASLTQPKSDAALSGQVPDLGRTRS
jgi:hypothetical protein